MIQERGKNNPGERKDAAGWCLWISKRWDLLQKTRTSQIANIHWIIEKAREFQKNICFCFIDYVKACDCVDHNKLGKILKEIRIPDHLTCLLRNLYAGQEATVRTGHGTTDWFQIGKGVHQGYILSPCLFNLYAEYIMWNAGLDEAQAGIKIARRNINNLKICRWHHPYGRKQRGIKEPLDKGERRKWKSWLKTQLQTIRSWHNWFHDFMTNRGGNNGNGRLYFLGLQNHCELWLQPWN